MYLFECRFILQVCKVLRGYGSFLACYIRKGRLQQRVKLSIALFVAAIEGWSDVRCIVCAVDVWLAVGCGITQRSLTHEWLSTYLDIVESETSTIFHPRMLQPYHKAPAHLNQKVDARDR